MVAFALLTQRTQRRFLRLPDMELDVDVTTVEEAAYVRIGTRSQVRGAAGVPARPEPSVGHAHS